MDCKAMTTPMESNLRYCVMLQCIVRWLGHWCTWWTRDQTFALLWTPYANTWQIREVFTWLLQSIFWGTWRVQLTMGSSTMQIKILTWRVMLIQIGQVVPSIGRALQSVVSVWDEVWSLGLAGSNPVALSTAEVEYVAACSASCEAVWLMKLLSDLFDLQMDATCIHCDNSCMKLL